MFYRTLLASDVIRASDEDLCSQLNHVWSSLLLMGMGLLISMVQYIGDPIQCLCPASMPEVHCNYTKALCWVKESYFDDENEGRALDDVILQETRISYYPWSPWILFFMAVTLKLPHAIWCSFAPQSDLHLGRLVDLADSEEDLDNLATVIHVWLVRTKRHYTDVFHKAKRMVSLIGMFWLGRHKRTFLTGLTIFVKTMYLGVSLCLFYSLNMFLGEDFTAYGWEILQDFMHGLPQISPKFPRQIICTIKIRQMNNVNRVSIQCILPINMYNQKIYVFLWFWFIFLSIMNAYSLLRSSYKLLSPSQRWQFVKNYVHILSHVDRQAERIRRGREHDLDWNRVRKASTGIPNGGLITMGENGLVLHLDKGNDNAEGESRTRRGSVRSVSTDNSIVRPRAKKRKRKIRAPPLTSIEMDQNGFNAALVKRGVNEDTACMIKYLGHDGVLVFRTLESAVGIVISNQIFHKLHDQIMAAVHHSDT